MIKAVIFDLDNTLIDLMEMKKQCLRASIDAMIGAGLDVERESAIKIFESMYLNYNVEDRTIFQKFLRKVHGHVDTRMLCHAILAYRRVKAGFLIPYPGARKTLITLKSMGLRLAIVSDAPRERGWLRLCATGLDDFFDVIVTFDDTKVRKPSPLPFLKAIRKLGFRPEECVMVGDVLGRDIDGAKKLGMLTAFAKYGTESYADLRQKKAKDIKADIVLHKVTDLIGFIERGI